MGLSTHILDTALGKPAAGVLVLLSEQTGDVWIQVGTARTDPDGRCRTLIDDGTLRSTQYRLRFEVEPYFAAQGLTSLYPFVEIAFRVLDPAQHHHIPLLIAANGYTTYRGS